MKNYRNQPSCIDCAFVFLKYDDDCGAEYFCTEDGEKRPLCGSVAMGEFEGDYDFHKWADWEGGRMVSERGICDSFKNTIKFKTCKECELGKSTSGRKKCCGYLLLRGDTAYIQKDGRISGDCPKGYWKRGVV